MVISDSLIALAYLSISALLYMVVRQVRVPYHSLFLAFGVFILACGATHAMEVYTLWVPNYWASGAIKVVTALASVATAIYLFKLFPQVVEVGEAAAEVSRTKSKIEDFFYNKLSTPPKVTQLLRQILLVPILFAAAVIVGGVFAVDHLRSLDRWVQHSGDVLKQADHLKHFASEAQNEFREFKLTGNPSLLKSAQENEKNFAETYAKLHSLTENDSDQEANVEKIQEIFSAWLEYREKNVVAPLLSNTEFVKRVAAFKSKTSSTIEGFMIHERELRSARAAQNRRIESMFIFAAGLYSILVALFFAFQGRNVVHRLSNSFGLALASERHSREKSEHAIAARDEFLSLASHELRTPLSALKLQLQLVERGAQKSLEPADSLTDSMRVALRQVDSLSSLIEDLLDTSRLNVGKFSLVRSDENLTTVVMDVVARFQETLRKAGCTVELNLGEGIVGFWDRRRLEQIIANLLSNAIKYASQSLIRVTTERRGENAVITVQDSGPGIPREMQSKIFERFERVHSGDNVGGLGLGLYIVRGIVEMKGGTVRVESEINQGAKFIIEIPMHQPETIENADA